MTEALVKIKRETIKRNPRAFSTETMVPEGHTVSFKINGPLPEFLIEDKNVFITKQDWNFGDVQRIEGVLLDEKLFDRLRELPGVEINWDNHIRTYRHMPEREYFFEYEDAEVECSNCGKRLLISQIVEEEIMNGGGDEYSVEVCPKCSRADSFPRKYEDIQEVIKNENIKA